MDAQTQKPPLGGVAMAAVVDAGEAVARDIRATLDRFAPATVTRRQSLARALLTSSVDHAISLTSLLSKRDPSCAYSAVTLFRPQLEALARGVLFGRKDKSTDADVERFLEKEKLPKREQADGTRREPYLRELLTDTREVLRAFLPPHLQEGAEVSFTYALNDYQGFIHAGKSVHLAYRQSDCGYVFMPNFVQLTSVAQHSVAMAHLAEGILGAIVYELPDIAAAITTRKVLIERYTRIQEEVFKTHALA